MANLHVRSNSLPSQSHPVSNDVEDQLRRLKSSEGASTSTASVRTKLASLRDLHKGIDNLIQMPSIQQDLTVEGRERWTSEFLELSLGLVDLCGFSRDVLSLSKGSIQELQLSIRRNRGGAPTDDQIYAYMTSRKKIAKMVNKFIKNFKSFSKNSTPSLAQESDLKAAAEMFKETEALDFTALKSVLILLSSEEGRLKKRSWSLISMFNKSQDTAEVQTVAEQLKSLEVAIQELEEELEAFYRSLLKARVSLLNALNH